MAMEITAAGALTTIQDKGRSGGAALGYQQSGACDTYAFLLANLLAGNLQSPGAAALEMTLRGISAHFDSTAVFALTGADMGAALNGRRLQLNTPYYAAPGDTLTMGLAAAGLRGYMAVYGGFAGDTVMGSRSTNLKCGFGGHEGRALKNGDILQIEAEPPIGFWPHWQQKFNSLRLQLAAGEGWLCHASRPWRFIGRQKIPLLRAVAGPQEEMFTQAGLHSLTHSCYTVTVDSNRMACKLQGEAIEMVNGADILSDGIVCGSVQVSANGQPIVMLADHQTTGGYAKIATVISADVPMLAQVRPGENIGFALVSPAAGGAAARRQARKLDYIKECLS